MRAIFFSGLIRTARAGGEWDLEEAQRGQMLFTNARP
jgi:hypothetical protein